MKRAFRWILEIDGIDAFTCQSTARPHATTEQIEIPYINDRRYLAGRMAWNEIPLTLHDPIAPSAAQKVLEWMYLQYEPLTGRAGYASFYKKDIHIKMLDGPGNVVEKWELQGTWITDANFDALDYGTEDTATVTLSLKYDRAILVY